MGCTGQGRQNTNKRQTTYRNATYVQGNAVRRVREVETPDVRRAIEAPVKKQLSHTTRKNRDKALHMSVGYVLFLSVALVVAGFVLIGYIRLQSDITNSVKNIERLESQLNHDRLENDEEYNRILASVNLEEIKRIAIEELGMTYANEGQIISYSSEGNDYVRQFAEIPPQ